MALFTLCSASGAPGVTTTALALTRTWSGAIAHRVALLVDADPVGSALIPAFVEGGIPTGGGILGVAAERAATADDVLRHAVALDESASCLILTGVSESGQARPLGGVWSTLVEVAHELERSGLDVIVDAGRLGHRWEPQPLIDAADVAVLVSRPTLPAVAAARTALAELRSRRLAGAATGVLVVGRPAPYSAGEVARALDAEALPELPEDVWASRALSLLGPVTPRLRRSALVRAVTQTAAALARTAAPARQVTAP
ncbi:hypothetical protein [Actinotalea solisilvae]|uniref:hypothetical protein n=1 Tax=Actinotalea solisilvae TaxID=2072922 RepID=UPI0018F23AE6|nr:hypothetical protein [Actinotalea solisilvae]